MCSRPLTVQPLSSRHWCVNLKALGMAALILALTLTLNVMTNFAPGAKQPSLDEEADWIKMFGTKNVHRISKKFFTFPAVLVNSIIAPVPKQQPNEYAILMNPAARHPFLFTFDSDEQKGYSTPPLLSPRNLAGIVLFLLLLLPIRASLKTDRSLFLLSWGALLIIAFNWALHSVWGWDRFLYSQHWHVSLMFLLATLVATQLHSSRVRIALVAASVILVAVNNLVVVRTILMVLQANMK
jgi:hypothetical protein